jgi:hypothetical protein
MKLNYCIISLLAVMLLACGVTTLTPHPPTGTPSPAKRVLHRTATAAPKTAVVCNGDTVNARGVSADMTLAVIARLSAGDMVTLTGDEFRIGMEVWQPTDKGAIDPQYLCEVK